MGKKNKRSVPCTLCARSFGSIVALQQHVRYFKHPKTSTRSTTAGVQPPVRKPQVQVKNEPAYTGTWSQPTTPSLGAVICEHCLASFPSSKDLKRHSITFHSWSCVKCPALPPFENGTTWQAHFKAVHAVGADETADTKEKEVTAPIKEDKPSQFVRDDPGRSEGSHSGELYGQHHDASHNTNTEVHSVAAAQLGPSLPNIAEVNQPDISSLPPGVVASGVTQDGTVLSASVDKTTSNSEDWAVRVDEHDLLSPRGPNLSALVEIDPEPYRGRDEPTYEIASDPGILSPTTTASSIETDEPEWEDDIELQSHSLEPLNGSSPEKEKHIVVPPRGPTSGDRESHTMGNAIVAGNHPRDGPDVQARSGLGGITPPTAREQYAVVKSDSPTPTTSSLQDPYQGDLSHDPSRTRRSKTGSVTATPEIHFKCRICLSDPTPTSSLTATHCGHLFCYECIAAEVLRASRCPVCNNVLALYCLFKLDVAP